METTIGEIGVGKRLDLFVTNYIAVSGPKWAKPIITRSVVGELVKRGVLVNGKVLKKSFRLRQGDKVRIDINELKEIVEGNKLNLGSSRIIPEHGELNIVDETKDWIVLNKPKGIVIHPGVNNNSGTLANFVAGYLESKGEYDETVKRGGVVHRLDKGVSGLVIFAKNRKTQLYLKKQFENRKVMKMYKAEVKKFKDTSFSKSIENLTGSTDSRLEIDKYISEGIGEQWTKIEGTIDRDSADRMRMKFSTNSHSGRYSSLYIKPLSKASFLVVLKTGRMHQIRATLNYLGYVILGDRLYGDSSIQNSDKIALESILLGLRVSRGINRVWKLI